jgi:hypothetical protein
MPLTVTSPGEAAAGALLELIRLRQQQQAEQQQQAAAGSDGSSSSSSSVGSGQRRSEAGSKRGAGSGALQPV